MQNIRKIKDLFNKFQTILTSNQKKWGIVVFFMILGGSLAEMLGVSIVLPFVQAILAPQELRENVIINKVCTFFGVQSDEGVVLLVSFVVILIYIIKNVYLGLVGYVRIKYAVKIQRELSIRMLVSYMKRGYSFFRMTNSSVLMRGTNGAVSGVYNVVVNCFKIVAELLTILCICIYIIVTDWKISVGMISLATIGLLLILNFFKEIMRKAGKQYHDGLGENNKIQLQLFGGIKEVLVLNRKDYFINKYIHAYSGLQKGQIRQAVASESPTYIIEGICVTGLILLVYFRVTGMENAAEYVPQLASFAVAAFRILPSIGRLSSCFNLCIFYIPAVNETYNNIVEAQKFDKLNENNASDVETDECHRLEKEIEIQNVSWKYQDGIEKVLDNINLTINKGESVAFVGPSGAGKSTLADIILGLFQPQEGGVLADGIDIHQHKNMWSKMVGFVPQSAFLIDDTIRRNIAFGIEDSKIDDERIWATLDKAQMKAFVQNLPKGLDTCVGDRGVRFSGGQAQRLAIARALYTDPDIIILDEATSALDNETETAVMEAIDALQGQKTMIIIAHRLTTIRNCNSIYEINNGKAIKRKYE